MATTTIQTRIVPIGNSQGIRLSKVVLEQSGLGEEVELEVNRHRIVIQPIHRPRQGWGEAFRTMAERGEDRLLDGEDTDTTAWDHEEWEW
jgi:antitoxin MazE